MFRDNLRRLVEQTPGGVAALLMGFDGISVESFAVENNKQDIQTVGMEFSHILMQVRKAADTIDTGNVEEVTIRTDRLLLVIRVLSREYFVALAISPTGSSGKGRFLLRVTAPKLQADM